MFQTISSQIVDDSPSRIDDLAPVSGRPSFARRFRWSYLTGSLIRQTFRNSWVDTAFFERVAHDALALVFGYGELESVMEGLVRFGPHLSGPVLGGRALQDVAHGLVDSCVVFGRGLDEGLFERSAQLKWVTDGER